MQGSFFYLFSMSVAFLHFHKIMVK